MEEKMEYLKDKAKKEYDEKSLTDPTNYPPMPSDNIKPVRAKMSQGKDGVGEVVVAEEVLDLVEVQFHYLLKDVQAKKVLNVF